MHLQLIETNPILTSIERLLNKKTKLSEEFFICMQPSHVNQLLDQVLREKVIEDLEMARGPIELRKPVYFHTFMYNFCLMQYGLPHIAIKVLM